MATCPCGLTRQELNTHHLVNNGFCTAPDANGNPCGRRLADHPFSAAAPPGNFILPFHSNIFILIYMIQIYHNKNIPVLFMSY